MERPRGTGGPIDPFPRPTSAVLCGSSSALQNWVAFAFATHTRAGYYWTDVRYDHQQLDPLDPMPKGAIPTDRLSVVRPGDLARNDTLANASISGGALADGSPADLAQLADFLRLPTPTQSLIASQRSHGAPLLLVLSNSQRLAALYPTDSVRPLIRAVVSAGLSVLLTYVDAPAEFVYAFENVWHLSATEVRSWRSVELRVERAPAESLFPSGTRRRLGEIPFVATTLGPVLDRPETADRTPSA